MVIFLRIMLLLLPIIAVVLWLRWRAKQKNDDADLQKELKRFKVAMAVILAAIVCVGLSLRVFDDSSGDTDTVYIPPHVVDGKVVPGRFVPKEEAENTQGND